MSEVVRRIVGGHVVADGRPERGGERDLEEGERRDVPRHLAVGSVQDTRLLARVQDPVGLVEVARHQPLAVAGVVERASAAEDVVEPGRAGIASPAEERDVEVAPAGGSARGTPEAGRRSARPRSPPASAAPERARSAAPGAGSPRSSRSGARAAVRRRRRCRRRPCDSRPARATGGPRPGAAGIRSSSAGSGGSVSRARGCRASG